jgi:hypothetical protein
MAYYIYDEKKKKVVEVTKEKFDFGKGKINNHINMRKTWSGTTKVEFSQTTIDKDIAERNAR